MLICHEKMENDLAYQIVKVLLEKQPDLVAVHKEAAHFTLQSAAVGLVHSLSSGGREILPGKGNQDEIRRPPIRLRLISGATLSSKDLPSPFAAERRLMDVKKEDLPAPEEFITAERLKKAAAYVEEEEGPSRRLAGRMGTFHHRRGDPHVPRPSLCGRRGDHDPDPAGDPRHVRPLPDLPGLPVPEALSPPRPLV